MSLHNFQQHIAEQHPFIRARWRDIRAAVTRWFDRERELVRLRISFGMMAEARAADAKEFHEFLERGQGLSDRIRQLEEERDAWRQSRPMVDVSAGDITRLGSGMADTVGVIRFAKEMEIKLGVKRAQGRGGWNDPDECSITALERMLSEHIAKGDPVDIANFAMMIWNRQHADGNA